MTDTTELPIALGSVPLPEVCSGCGGALIFDEEKVCVPGQAPRARTFTEVSTFGAHLRFGLQEPPSPTRLYHPACAPR